MNPENSSIIQKFGRLIQILYELKQKGDLPGILLSYKNGELIYNIFNTDIKNLNGHELSSMCASVLESANSLSRVVGENKLIKIVAELNLYMLVIIQCDENIFLTFIVDHNSHVNDALNSIETYIKKIIFLYESS